MSSGTTVKPVSSNILIIGGATEEIEELIKVLETITRLDFAYRVASAISEVETALQEQKWDLILADYDQGRLDSSATLQLAQHTQPATPCIFMAEAAPVQATVKLMRAGARGLVEKEDRSFLVELVRQELEGRPTLPVTTTEETYRNIVNPQTERERHAPLAEKMKTQLVEQHEQLTSVLNTMQDAIISLSLPDRQLIFASPSVDKIFGYSLESILAEKRNFEKIVHPDDLARALQAMKTCLQDGFVELDHRIIWPDGQVRWLQRRAWVNYDEEGHPVRVNDTARDITERKLAEEALRASEERFRRVVESINAHIYVPQISPEKTFSNEYVSPNVKKITGYSPEKFLENRNLWQELIKEEDLAVYERHQQKLLQGEDSLAEYRVRSADGNEHWVQDNARVTCHEDGAMTIYATITDITERKKTELALVENERTLKLFVEYAPAAIAMLDRNMRYLSVSRRWLTDYRLEEQSVIGRSHYEIFPDIPDRWREIHQRCLNGAIEKNEADPFPRTDGSLDWVRWEIHPWRDSHGQIGGILLFSEVITARKETEDALRRTNQRLEILHAIDLGLISRGSIEELVNWVMKQVRCLIPCQQAGMALYDLEKNEMVTYAGDSSNPTEWTKNQRLPFQSGVFKGFEKDNFKLIEDINLRPELHPYYPNLIKDGMRSTFNILLKIENKPLGIFALNSDTPDFFTPEYRKIAFEISNQLAIAIHQMQLSETIIRYNTELEQRVAERTAELEKFKNRIEAIFNHSGDGILLLDTEHGIQQTNNAFNAMFGLQANNYFGSKLAALFPPEEIVRLEEIIREVVNNRQIKQIEALARRLDGTDIEVEVSIAPVNPAESDQKVRNLVFIFRNIAERKQTELAIRESGERYRLLAENVTDIIIKYSVDGICTYITPSVYNKLGYTPDEIVGQQTADYIHPEDRIKSDRASTRAFVTGAASFTISHRIRHKDGHYSWFESTNSIMRDQLTGQPIGGVAVFRDIMERKLTEDALLTISQRLQLATETGGIGIWDWDLQTDEIIWDDQMLALHDIRRQEMGHTSQELAKSIHIHPEDQDRIHQEFNDAIGWIKPLDTEFRVFHKNETLHYIKIKAVVFRDENKKPVRAIGVNWDITILKQAEENLRRALEKEKELGELKSRFVSMASHEFRTPLAAILATTETLIRYRERMDQIQIDSRLDKIRKQVEHMKEIMDDVLQLARIQAGRVEFKPEKGNLDTLCHDIIEEFESQENNRGRIKFDCSNPPVIVEYDTHLFRQVFSNLISNALKYSPVDKPVQITLTRYTTQVVLQVRDQGIGIPPEDLKHLFEPFHRASNVGTISGTGLGLNITRQAIELHGGTITLESELGLGTTFTVLIPLILAKDFKRGKNHID